MKGRLNLGLQICINATAVWEIDYQSIFHLLKAVKNLLNIILKGLKIEFYWRGPPHSSFSAIALTLFPT